MTKGQLIIKFPVNS